MTARYDEFVVKSFKGQSSFIDVTNEVREFVQQSGVHEGICTVATTHTTCAVFLEEYTHDEDSQGVDYLSVDLERVLTKLVPRHSSKDSYLYPGEKHYRAVESWPNAEDYLPGGDRTLLFNGDAHIKATIIGESVTIPIKGSKLTLGTTGYVYFADFDQTQERKRKVQVVVIGE
ncbi:YjbQ family protein [Streptococcus massiliensis]|uniref:Uncharacterized conserved protein n=1 Tax=Streptococcus massiliensis TaxID=313439 RepID=A0A380L260_9STRE|nr:YjbQ family protein [Streptococcus massiliensis]SUN77435.1 Uncharacterized conserved protein [Streptococcus massiliensis]